MSNNLKGTLVPRSSQIDSSKTMSGERKGLLSGFDAGDNDNGEPPRLGDEECPGPRGRSPLRKSMIVGMARGFVALILGVMLFVPMSRSLCNRISAASKLAGTSRLLSNGTYEFERTVLIVSIDGLR
jgi:hypothetical protein